LEFRRVLFRSADFSLGRASGVVDLSLCPMASSVARSAAKKARTSKKVRMVLMMHGLDLKKILPSHGLPYHNLGQPPRGRIHHQWSERAVFNGFFPFDFPQFFLPMVLGSNTLKVAILAVGFAKHFRECPVQRLFSDIHTEGQRSFSGAVKACRPLPSWISTH